MVQNESLSRALTACTHVLWQGRAATGGGEGGGGTAVSGHSPGLVRIPFTFPHAASLCNGEDSLPMVVLTLNVRKSAVGHHSGLSQQSSVSFI